MNDKPIELPLVQKKPYARPQLHDLNGSEADGKASTSVAESGRNLAPS
jgi:hypothetical protein